MKNDPTFDMPSQIVNAVNMSVHSRAETDRRIDRDGWAARTAGSAAQKTKH